MEASDWPTLPCQDFEPNEKCLTSNTQLGTDDSRRDKGPIDESQNTTPPTTWQPKQMPNMAWRLSQGTGSGKGNDTKKWLKQLIRMEEQQNHAWQIKRANHALWGGRGLTKVTTINATGEKEHHYSKENIKGACLEEVQTQFTQSNNTSFLTEPLLSELGLLGTRWEQFNKIMRGSYKPPLGSLNNTLKLIPLLQWPTTITDQPLSITAEQHKQGWTKAKEATSLSLLGAHFGH